ncbi:hypothetical protein SAMN02745163_03658 [Clostridium cavendishii DSM 21758]|uniref:Uncharacterized protein n=1 Tax=Clostridium cavendishii DSM 21758 TaxID=1121302 RepID=A0A1M6RSC2_9CLOT|nr:hypothetical protein [Clostridium cavendishii]SHK35304.1 hypothetical protein SAMN02745163_03658 [Clostridium cavendishii DSM 21758]
MEDIIGKITEFTNGKTKVIITRVSSGEDKTKELLRAVMPECEITFKPELDEIIGVKNKYK